MLDFASHKKTLLKISEIILDLILQKQLKSIIYITAFKMSSDSRPFRAAAAQDGSVTGLQNVGHRVRTGLTGVMWSSVCQEIRQDETEQSWQQE